MAYLVVVCALAHDSRNKAPIGIEANCRTGTRRLFRYRLFTWHVYVLRKSYKLCRTVKLYGTEYLLSDAGIWKNWQKIGILASTINSTADASIAVYAMESHVEGAACTRILRQRSVRYSHEIHSHILFVCSLRLTVREGFFLVPISPPVHFEGVENRHFFFLDGRFCEQHLSERAVLWTARVYGQARAQL